METITLKSSFPECIGEFQLSNKEYMQYLYLPVAFPHHAVLRLEPRLEFLREMIYMAAYDFFEFVNGKNARYCYLTVKQTFVPAGADHNRPGWHSDGFGTDDVQYIFCDKWPTEFLIGDIDVRNDDKVSMADMITFDMTHPKSTRTVEPGKLYRLHQNHVHRVTPAPESGVRMFVKVTFSRHKYAQKGNSHNYELDYDWGLSDRSNDRNQPHSH